MLGSHLRLWIRNDLLIARWEVQSRHSTARLVARIPLIKDE